MFHHYVSDKQPRRCWSPANKPTQHASPRKHSARMTFPPHRVSDAVAIAGAYSLRSAESPTYGKVKARNVLQLLVEILLGCLPRPRLIFGLNASTTSAASAVFVGQRSTTDASGNQMDTLKREQQRPGSIAFDLSRAFWQCRAKSRLDGPRTDRVTIFSAVDPAARQDESRRSAIISVYWAQKMKMA